MTAIINTTNFITLKGRDTRKGLTSSQYTTERVTDDDKKRAMNVYSRGLKYFINLLLNVFDSGFHLKAIVRLNQFAINAR